MLHKNVHPGPSSDFVILHTHRLNDGQHAVPASGVMPPFPMSPCALDHGVFVRDNRTLYRVAVRDMIHLEADGNYVELVLNTRRFVLRNSVAEVLKAMPDGLFAMVNRKQAVNLLLVESVSSDEVSIGRNSYTLSRRYREQLLSRLHVISGR
jgi:hypothetical protein